MQVSDCCRVILNVLYIHMHVHILKMIISDPHTEIEHMCTYSTLYCTVSTQSVHRDFIGTCVQPPSSVKSGQGSQRRWRTASSSGNRAVSLVKIKIPPPRLHQSTRCSHDRHRATHSAGRVTKITQRTLSVKKWSQSLSHFCYFKTLQHWIQIRFTSAMSSCHREK